MATKGFATTSSSRYVSPHFDGGATRLLKGFYSLTGAEENALPHPIEYNTNVYASLLDAPYPTPADLQSAIDKTDWFITEFQRQVQHHTDNNDAPNAKVAQGWMETAQKTNQALRDKLAGIKSTAGSGAGSSATAGAGTIPTPSKGIGTGGKIAIGVVAVALFVGLGFKIFHKKKLATA